MSNSPDSPRRRSHKRAAPDDDPHSVPPQQLAEVELQEGSLVEDDELEEQLFAATAATAAATATPVLTDPDTSASLDSAGSLGSSCPRFKRQRTASDESHTPVIDARDPGEQLWGELGVAVGAADACGQRAFMEDAHFFVADIDGFVHPERSSSSSLAATDAPKSYSAFAVLDGHAGDRAARFVVQNLPQRICASIVASNGDVAQALPVAFRETDAALLREAVSSVVQWKDGCTAIVAVMSGRTDIHVANIGDCRAVLAQQIEPPSLPPMPRRARSDSALGAAVEESTSKAAAVADSAPAKLVAVPLSKDHVASDPEERARIEAAGGRVTNARVMGIMEVSRTFGDNRFKHVGVTSTPDVVHHVLETPRDRFLLLASDGLWKVLGNQGAVDFVQRVLAHEQSAGLPSAAQTAAHALVQEALRLGSQDNVTVLVLVF